jgi:CheY-like chemotaxis protein
MMDHENRVVLVVDDDDDVLGAVEAMLRCRGCSPIAASGALEALE